MTKQEVQAKSREKVQAVETLCKQLELVVSAEQVIVDGGFIKLVVYYTDMQKYDIDDESVKPEEEETKPEEEKPLQADV